jgi:ribosomal protein S18 acetylase RimI-like enzyme
MATKGRVATHVHLEGFRPVERWEHRFDLAFTPERPAEPREPFDVRPWDAGAKIAAADLLATVNATTLDGLYLTWPDTPAPETCRRVLADFVAGSHGPFSAAVSFQAWRGSDLAGLTLVSLPEPGEALLFEIAVRFRHRGTGLARHLLDRLKLGLRPQGFRTVRFLACGHNAAVSALFRPEEVESRSLDRGFVWMRG